MRVDTFKEFLTDILIENRSLEDRIREYENELDRVELANARMKDELEELRSKSVMKWIPVENCLPEENGKYLVCCDDGYITKIRYDRGYWNGSPENREWMFENVVAWMPLPEPYKAEEDTDGSD